MVSLGQGKIFKILPTADLDMSSSAGSIPSIPLASPTTTLPPEGDETVGAGNEDNIEQEPEEESNGDGEGNNDDNSENGSGGGDDN